MIDIFQELIRLIDKEAIVCYEHTKMGEED